MLIRITGTGAVSAAGWGVPALMGVLDGEARPECSELIRVTKRGESVISRVLRVPGAPPSFPKSPRLRRASPISKFAVAAAVEALGPERLAQSIAGELRLGVVCSLFNGCVNYSNRFFGEVVADPTVASPILFPETVFNAPSSHLSALFQSTAPNDTILGDGAEVFTAMEIATEWLRRGDCDAVLVVAPEEIDWLSAEGLCYYGRRAIASEGAAAVLLEIAEQGVVLSAIPDPVPLGPGVDRAGALNALVAATGARDDGRTLLADSRRGVPRLDRAEELAFGGWTGPQVSVRKLLGDGFGASTGLQLVAAVEQLKRGSAEQALVVALGGNEQAAGCWVG